MAVTSRYIFSAAIALLTFAHAEPGRLQLYPSPSDLNISDITRDNHGLIWIASKEGVFRFDGTNYHHIPGYPFHSAQKIIYTAGFLWAGGTEGLAKYDNNGNWTVIFRKPVDSLASGPSIASTGELVIAAPDGSTQTVPAAHVAGELVSGPSGVIWFPSAPGLISSYDPATHKLETLKNPIPNVAWRKIVPSNGGYWLSSTGELAFVKNGRVQSREKVALTTDSQLDPDLTANGTVWSRRPHVRSLPSWTTWPLTAVATWFQNDSVRWFASPDKLAKSVLDPTTWQTWAGLGFTSTTTEGFVTRPNATPLLVTNHGVLELEAALKGGAQTASKVDAVNAITDGYGGYWLATRDEGLLRANGNGQVVDRFPNLCASIDTMRALLRDGRGRTWAGGKDNNCFFEIRGQPGHWKFIPQDLPGGTFQTVELQTDPQGRPWIGYEHGIAYLDDATGHWTTITTPDPVTYIRTIEFEGPDTLWVTQRRPLGTYLRLRRNGAKWEVNRFPGTSQTNFIRRDSRGWLWRASRAEIFVTLPGRYHPTDWIQITDQNGLAGPGINLRGWAEDDHGDIWLAGAAGITKVRPSLAWFEPPRAKPLVSRVHAGSQTWLDPAHLPGNLPSGEPVEIDLSTIDANPFHRQPLHYRLNRGSWLASTDGHIRLDKMPTGTYNLEAAYTGADDSYQWTFEAGHPLLLRLLLPLLALAAAPIIWIRRAWLQYWIRKPLFLLRRSLDATDQDVAWTNYVGRSLQQRYEVQRALSRGGFSVTYLAHDTETNQPVVLKVLHRTPGQERWIRQRFAHEVAALHTLHHPGIVRLLDSWIEAEGEPCLVMDYIQGPTLREVLNDSAPLPRPRAAAILRELGAALDAIHARGFVHRDLKPENIILAEWGRAVVIDFGSSAARGPENDIEHTTTLTGSMHYLAPERLAGQYSPASDIYSLGVITLEMLSGKRPAEMELATADPKFVEMITKWTGSAEAAVMISAALQHQPLKRPAHIGEWVKVLAALLEAG